jgi:hypothetical protein
MKVYIILMATSVFTCVPLIAQVQSNEDDLVKTLFTHFHKADALTVDSFINQFSGIGNSKQCLLQKATFEGIDGQKGRVECLTINPASKDFLFIGKYLNSNSTLFGCARINQTDIIYSSSMKKWFVTLPGATDFMVQNALDRIFFESSSAVRNLYSTGLEEWHEGLLYNQGEMIAQGLDQLTSLDINFKDNGAVWQYRVGAMVFRDKVDVNGMIQSMTITQGRSVQVAVTNEMSPLSTIAIPSNDTIDWSGKDRVSHIKPLTEEDAIHAVQMLASKGPVFGFAFNKNQNGTITVLGVEPGTPAERAGLKAGMEIVQVNGTPVTKIDQAALMEILHQASEVLIDTKGEKGIEHMSLKK